jgi:hypothetical protein
MGADQSGRGVADATPKPTKGANDDAAAQTSHRFGGFSRPSKISKVRPRRACGPFRAGAANDPRIERLVNPVRSREPRANLGPISRICNARAR